MDDLLESGKKDNYCSSSSEEDMDDGPDVGTTPTSSSTFRSNKEGSYNTGPKGVLSDWRQYQKLQEDRQAAREQELLSLAKRVSLTCRSVLDDENDQNQKQIECTEIDDDDKFLNEYAERRMQEMLRSNIARKKGQFGEVYELSDSNAYLNAIDTDSKSSTIVIHIYENNVKACETLNSCLATLASNYTMVKFFRVRASLLGASDNLRTKGLPTILAYRNCQLIGNFVRVGDELDDTFDSDDVEQFLKEYAVIPDFSNSTNITDNKGTRRTTLAHRTDQSSESDLD